MDVTDKLLLKLKKLLKKLKNLGIIKTFKLEINFFQVDRNLTRSLFEIDSVLKKCHRKIVNKPRNAEIRNVISELVRKKNLSNIVIPGKSESLESPVQGELLSGNCLNKPISENITSLDFKCGFCEEIFNSKKQLIVHKKIHRDSDEYLCEKCGNMFYNIQTWEEHLKNYNSSVIVPFALNKLPGDLKDGMLIFSKELDALTESNTVSENLLIKTVDKVKIKNSIQSSNLDNYLSKKDETLFVCSCGKIFKLLKTLKKHEKLKHSSKHIKYDCRFCGKIFLEKGKLNRHMLSHEECQYSCSFCSKKFSRSDTLKRHMSFFHYISKEFVCTYCQKKFKLKYNRDVHEENVHRNAVNEFKCHHCGQKFKTKITLKSHIKIHSGNKITCTVCCKSFNRNSYYKSHVKNKHLSNIAG